jgi:hypothetical protein
MTKTISPAFIEGSWFDNLTMTAVMESSFFVKYTSAFLEKEEVK